ncbi:MAG: hypothetical protein R3B48_03935 [Kofleriaceae bacterium]
MTGLAAAAASLLLAAGNQEAASVLAIAATALLAGQRWALGLVIAAEVVLTGSLWAAALGPTRLPSGSWICLVAALPGLASFRRGTAALVILTGLRRSRTTYRAVHGALVAVAILSALPW